MTQSFDNKKELKFVITLGTGKFGSSNANQITLQGFRAQALIDRAGGMMMGQLRAKIYGVSQADMNSITTLQWKPGNTVTNTIQVFAIDGAQQSLVFTGYIINAWGDYAGVPQAFLMIQAQQAFLNQVQAVPPRSYAGPVDVATVLGQICNDMGFTLENNGVSVMLTDVYVANTNIQQIRTLAKAANIDIYFDDTILAICPRNAPRTAFVPIISPQTGLVGYPTFDGTGVNFMSLFNPLIVFGGLVDIQTSITQAAGKWIASNIGLNLESEKPGGSWFSTVRGTTNGLAP